MPARRRISIHTRQGLRVEPSTRPTFLAGGRLAPASKLVSTLHYRESARSIFDGHRYVGYRRRGVIDFASRLSVCSSCRGVERWFSYPTQLTDSHRPTNNTYLAAYSYLRNCTPASAIYSTKRRRHSFAAASNAIIKNGKRGEKETAEIERFACKSINATYPPRWTDTRMDICRTELFR